MITFRSCVTRHQGHKIASDATSSGEISKVWKPANITTYTPFQQIPKSSHLPLHSDISICLHTIKRVVCIILSIPIQDTELMPTSMTTQPGFSHVPPQGSRFYTLDSLDGLSLNIEMTHKLWTQRTNSAWPIATTT